MPTTRVLQSRTSAECIKLSPQTADLLVPLGGQAQDLRPPSHNLCVQGYDLLVPTGHDCP